METTYTYLHNADVLIRFDQKYFTAISIFTFKGENYEKILLVRFTFLFGIGGNHKSYFVRTSCFGSLNEFASQVHLNNIFIYPFYTMDYSFWFETMGLGCLILYIKWK